MSDRCKSSRLSPLRTRTACTNRSRRYSRKKASFLRAYVDISQNTVVSRVQSGELIQCRGFWVARGTVGTAEQPWDLDTSLGV